MKLSLVLVAAAVALAPARASAQTGEHVDSAASLGPRSLRQRFGAEVARRLLREPEGPTQLSDALRGIERAASLGTEEGPLMLVQLLADPRGLAHADARVVLAATRALAPMTRDRSVVRALAEYVLSTGASRSAHKPADDSEPTSQDTDGRARLELARAAAALALAESGDEHAMELLVAAARGGGAGQTAAILALRAFPPVVPLENATLTPAAIALVAALGDLRANDAIVEAAKSIDPQLRAAAFRALGATHDERVIPLAAGADGDSDPTVRRAAAEALVDVGAKEAAHAVQRLLDDDATAALGCALSTRVLGGELTDALLARAHSPGDASLRAAAVVALGHRPDPKALAGLTELMLDAALAGDAGEALARSPSAGAWAVIEQLFASTAPRRRLAARMAAVRGREPGAVVPRAVQRALSGLAASADGADRAVALAAGVLLGVPSARRGLGDPDPRVRRAVAMAFEPTRDEDAAALLRQKDHEDDRDARLVLMAGLARGDEAAVVSTGELLSRAREAESDAPLAILALARRALARDRDAVDVALTSPNPVYRSHAALGLAGSKDPTASGRLAEAYEEETDPGTRRAIILALAARTVDRGAPVRDQALDRAGRFDADGSIRAIAFRALIGESIPQGPPPTDVLWLRAMQRDGKAPASPSVTGLVIRADGIAVPVAFDDDGYALIPGPTGPARLVLAPRLPTYKALPHAD